MNIVLLRNHLPLLPAKDPAPAKPLTRSEQLRLSLKAIVSSFKKAA